MAKRGNPDKLNHHEIEILSKKWAMIEVTREKKHLAAYLKGKQFYKVYGRTYPVLTPETIEQQKAMGLTAKPNEEEE